MNFSDYASQTYNVLLTCLHQAADSPAFCRMLADTLAPSHTNTQEGDTVNMLALAVMLAHVCLCDTLQDILPELYCGHDAFLFSSRYKAWGMPVLEAMAAGLAVVATACLGLDTFARHGMNALLAAPQVGRCL